MSPSSTRMQLSFSPAAKRTASSSEGALRISKSGWSKVSKVKVEAGVRELDERVSLEAVVNSVPLEEFLCA
jgi:hypothetical protein